MLTFRSNTARSLHAAYRGSCRVGYVERSGETWMWWLSLVRPSGGGYSGRCDTVEQAKRACEAAMADWCRAASLMPATSGATQTTMELH